MDLSKKETKHTELFALQFLYKCNYKQFDDISGHVLTQLHACAVSCDMKTTDK